MNRTSLLSRILGLHLHPEEGSRYWLEREKSLGFSIRDKIQTEKDLYLLGPTHLDDLRGRPVEDFIPKKFLKEKRTLIVCETGGAGGIPTSTAYFEDEFDSVFVESFNRIADPLGVPREGRWLWIGPGGPHIIGKAAQAIAIKRSGVSAFAIDFDPRWYRRLVPGSIARNRYLDHVLSQSLRILRTQTISFLFSTPVVLEKLLELAEPSIREKILGIHLGGMPIRMASLEKIRDAFPHAVLIAGYGNTLFGVCHAVRDLRFENSRVDYFPLAERLRIDLVTLEDVPVTEKLRTPVAYDQRGQVVFHRLDESYFLPNVLERDSAIRIPMPEEGVRLNGTWDGLGDPEPRVSQTFKTEVGIY